MCVCVWGGVDGKECNRHGGDGHELQLMILVS